MVDDAKSHADEDRKRQEEIEARNRADSLIYSTEKLLRENRDKLPPADVEAVEKALAETRSAVEQGGKERILAAVESLTRASHRLAEVLYQKTAAEPAPPAEGDATKDKGDVVDAEVVDEK